MTYTNYFISDELLCLYPRTKIWGWDKRKIGIFYRCLLIDGHRFGKNQRLLVSKRSFENLVNYKSELDISADFCSMYMSYGEILEEIPQAEFYRWNPTVIGTLKSAGLLRGKRLGKESTNAITEQSIESLIKFTSQRFTNIGNL